MRFRPSFEYGFTGGEQTLTLSLSQRLWSPEEGIALGHEAISVAGIPFSEWLRYDQAVAMTIRFTDDEYLAVMAFVEFSLHRKHLPIALSLEYGNVAAAANYTVYMEFPHARARVQPRRSSSAPWTWELDLIFRTVDGTRVHLGLYSAIELPEPPSLIFLQDAMIDAPGTDLSAHMPEIGDAWGVHPAIAGSMVVSDANRVRGGTSDGTRQYINETVPLSPNYRISADYFNAGAGGIPGAGLRGRLTSPGDGGYTWWCNITINRWELYDQAVMLGSYVGGVPGIGASVNGELRMEGDQISGYVAGVLRVGPFTNASYMAAGRVGLRTFITGDAYQNTRGIHFHNVIAEGL